MTRIPENSSRSGRAEWLMVASGLTLVVMLALRLASVALNPSLSSDVLYPHLFAADALAGTYPLTGWSFGAATFFFPDYLLYLPILAATGPGGESFAVYAVAWFLALAALVAAVGRWWAGCRPAAAWLAGVLTATAALTLQFLPGHVPVLWWLPLPGYHGGTLLNGLALIALTGRLLGGPPAGRAVWLGTGVVLCLGLSSNALLLVQFAAPLLVAVWWLHRRGAAPPGFLWRFALLCGGAGAGVLALRAGLALAEWGYFYPIGFRHIPTPGVLWRAAGKVFHDTAADLGPHAWGWGLGLSAWLALLVADVRAPRRTEVELRRLALHLLVALGVCATADVLIASGWWKNWLNARYLLNVLLLPLVVCVLAAAQGPLAARFLRSGRALRATVLVAALATMGVAESLDPAGWRFQRTPAARDLAAIVARHGLHHGLAGYWQANLLNALAGPDAASRLGQLNEDASPYFWCNNAFWYFEPPAPDGTLRWPRFDFVLTAGLDRAAVLARFGPPAEVVREGAWEMLVYDAAGQERIRAALMPAIVDKLGPSRLRGFRPAP